MKIKENGIENQQKQRKSTYENYAHIHLIMCCEWQPATTILCTPARTESPTKMLAFGLFLYFVYSLKNFYFWSFSFSFTLCVCVVGPSICSRSLSHTGEQILSVYVCAHVQYMYINLDGRPVCIRLFRAPVNCN